MNIRTTMENQRINKTTKSKLSEFTIEEIRGWIIDQMYNIESQIDFIICDYFDPKNKNEFKKIILNSSIISIGGKIKILRNIKSFDKKVIDKIQKFSSIRNAFAHLPVTELVHINITKDENGEFKSSEVSKIISQIEVMNSNGELKMKNSQELITEFFELNNEIKEYLLSSNHS